MSVPNVPKPFPQQMGTGQSSVPSVPALYRAGTEGTVTKRQIQLSVIEGIEDAQ